MVCRDGCFAGLPQISCGNDSRCTRGPGLSRHSSRGTDLMSCALALLGGCHPAEADAVPATASGDWACPVFTMSIVYLDFRRGGGGHRHGYHGVGVDAMGPAHAASRGVGADSSVAEAWLRQFGRAHRHAPWHVRRWSLILGSPCPADRSRTLPPKSACYSIKWARHTLPMTVSEDPSR